MLGRRLLLQGAVACAAGAVVRLAIARAAPAARGRTVEIRTRIDLPATLGGARVWIPVSGGIDVQGDADHMERSSGVVIASWRGGALAPWIEVTDRFAVGPGDARSTLYGLGRPWAETAAGPLDAGDFRCAVTMRDLAA